MESVRGAPVTALVHMLGGAFAVTRRDGRLDLRRIPKHGRAENVARNPKFALDHEDVLGRDGATPRHHLADELLRDAESARERGLLPSGELEGTDCL